MKVLIIGDSISLPGHGNLYEDTYVAKLKVTFKYLDIIAILQRGLTTTVLNTLGGDGIDVPNGADCLDVYNPDYVIIQLGIVDCAPRLFRNNGIGKKILRRIPNENLQQGFVKLIKVTGKRSQSKCYVNIKDFEKNIVTYLKRCTNIGVKGVIIIGVPNPDEAMKNVNDRLFKASQDYNEIYKKIEKTFENVSLVTPLDSRKTHVKIFEDGYHPNRLGHDIIFNTLKDYFNEQSD